MSDQLSTDRDVLAIGGCKHGLTLPPSRSPDLCVMPPLPIADMVAAWDNPDPVAVMPEVQRYALRYARVAGRDQRHSIVFPVWVESSMPLEQAWPWVGLLLIWLQINGRLARAGLLLYVAQLRQLEADVAEAEAWAALRRKMIAVLDEAIMDGVWHPKDWPDV